MAARGALSTRAYEKGGLLCLFLCHNPMADPPPLKPLTLTPSNQAVIALRANSSGGGGGSGGSGGGRGQALELRAGEEAVVGEAAGTGDDAGPAPADEAAGPSPASTTNAVGTAVVFAVPASRLVRWLWARRRPIGGLAMGVAAGGPGVVGRGLVRLGAASLAAALVGWRPIQALAVLGCVPAGAGLQVRWGGGDGVWREQRALTLRQKERKKKEKHWRVRGSRAIGRRARRPPCPPSATAPTHPGGS